VLYLASRFAETTQRLTAAHVALAEAKSPRYSIVYTWLFQAMTQQHLGHTDEARNWLEKAVKAI
jgi:hypothetical protein